MRQGRWVFWRRCRATVEGGGPSSSLEVLPVALEEVVNEGFLSRYRALLDAEDSAFDELEHAYEDGDREHFLADLATWSTAIQRRCAFLTRAGVPLERSQDQGVQNVDALA